MIHGEISRSDRRAMAWKDKPSCRGPFRRILVSAVLCGLGVVTLCPPTVASCDELNDEGQTERAASAAPAHDALECTLCHQQALIDQFESIRTQSNLPLPPGHDRINEQTTLAADGYSNLQAKCRTCHQEEFRQWLQSGHSMTFAQSFLNRQHNRMEQLNNDCLRCHGMFFQGTIEDVVAPVSTVGPWKLVDEQLAKRPAIPCLACHQIHPETYTVLSPSSANPQIVTAHQGEHACGFFDRREHRYFPAAQLPTPRIHDGGKKIDIASDERTGVCYQCHAPDATHQAGTSDDRTPRGVHAGLSCFDCHPVHSLRARESCGKCHPAISHCGLDVRRMDTTYSAKASRHDIHTVACQDCHPDGTPNASR